MRQVLTFDTMNETDVREVIVRPLIERLGYRHATDPQKDPPLMGRADYICEVVSFGRWVVEVKSPAEALCQDVVEQAHTYASHPEIAASF